MPYPNAYNPYGMPQYGNQFQSAQLSRSEVVRVNGRGGAEMYQLAPNSSILMLDETAPIVWLKQTDGGGYPTITPYSITPYEPEKPVDLHLLENRIARLEEMINGKSDNSKDDGKQKPSTELRKN